MSELIGRIGLLWLDHRPLSKASRARRKARRKSRRGEPLTQQEIEIMAQETVQITLPSGEVIERVEPTIKARTSTKVLGATGLGFAASLVTLVPFYEEINNVLLQACQSEQGPTVFLVGFGAASAIAFGTARFTKSPAVPGKV